MTQIKVRIEMKNISASKRHHILAVNVMKCDKIFHCIQPPDFLCFLAYKTLDISTRYSSYVAVPQIKAKNFFCSIFFALFKKL